MNEAIFDAIDSELALSSRLNSARSVAVSTALNALMLTGQAEIKGFNIERAAGMSGEIGQIIDGLFAKFDFIQAMRDTVDHASYIHSKNFKADPAALFESMSPESRTAMAEQVYAAIGKTVATELIDSLRDQAQRAAR